MSYEDAIERMSRITELLRLRARVEADLEHVIDMTCSIDYWHNTFRKDLSRDIEEMSLEHLVVLKNFFTCLLPEIEAFIKVRMSSVKGLCSKIEDFDKEIEELKQSF